MQAAVDEYDEFGLFRDNADEVGLPWTGPPVVRREGVELAGGQRVSTLVWGTGSPELVLLHGGAQNAHTWDTVALALDRPLLAIDLPGHGHSGWRTDRAYWPPENAQAVAAVMEQVAPDAAAVVGMSLGGLTALVLSAQSPALVRKLALVDVTPGVNRDKASAITSFVNGPESFSSFDELLERTVLFNPTRSEASLRRGILHNALQRDDGTWVWRHARFRSGEQPGAQRSEPFGAWDAVSDLDVPLMLVRGMREQSVVSDEDEAELLRRQ